MDRGARARRVDLDDLTPDLIGGGETALGRPERTLPGQKLVQDDSQREDVGSRIDHGRTGVRLLRAHVRGGSERSAYLGQQRRRPELLPTDRLGNPEVDDP